MKPRKVGGSVTNGVDVLTATATAIGLAARVGSCAATSGVTGLTHDAKMVTTINEILITITYHVRVPVTV